MTSNTPHIFITAGDPSGDVHAAALMREIRKLEPGVVFEGFGGVEMEMEGLRSLASMRDIAVTGFWEVAKRIRFFRDLLGRCEQAIGRIRPAAFIPVDYPGFNMRLAARVRSRRLPVLWYIAPQLWAWGEDRAMKLAASVDHLLAVFPFEEEFFTKHGIRTTYVGHPMMDVVSKETMVPREQGRVLLMPGSRRQETHRHVPLLAHTIDVFRKQGGTAQFVVARAQNVQDRELGALVQRGVEVCESAHVEMYRSSAGLIKAGTSTLEAAVRGLPFATYYRTSPLSYHISKQLVRVESVTMANLLLKRNAVREFIQHAATPEALAVEIQQLLTSHEHRSELTAAMVEVQQMLRGAGAAARAANIVVGNMYR